MLFKASELYQEYKRNYHACSDVLEALKRNYTDEATIQKAEKARLINESLANLWGRVAKYNEPEDRGYASYSKGDGGR